jgi:carbonic anhydrase/acetyltransferase-like protein (isoleucine patch superfamily)
MGAMVAPGTTIGKHSLADTGTMIGVRCRIGDNVTLAPMVGIHHAVSIGDDSTVGSYTYIGTRARIGEKIEIPAGSHIHPGVRLRSMEDVQMYFSEETGAITRAKSKINVDIAELKKSLLTNETGTEDEKASSRAKTQSGTAG